MSIVHLIIVGAAGGYIAQWIVPQKKRMGFIRTTGLGILGALAGNFVMRFIPFGWDPFGWHFLSGTLRSVILAACGAALITYLMERKTRRTSA